jgi:3-deoxy-D-manno-octulosonic-acid transferase
MISAIFRKDHQFFKWYGGWMLRQLKKITGFFVQDEESAELLRAKGIGQVIVSGDTRFDRVASIAERAKPFPLVEKFAAGSAVFLAGSTWPPDEELIIKLMEAAGDKMKFIIAPHEVGVERVKVLRDKIPNSKFQIPGKFEIQNPNSGTRNPEPGTVLFSELTDDNATSASVLIVDGMGYLSHLYQYATVAYIGGGFGVGIHNILEAATFGKPVIFGPKYQKFAEAKELIAEGGAFSISDSKQLNKKAIRLVTFPELLKKTSLTCAAFVQKKKGATGIIISHLTI